MSIFRADIQRTEYNLALNGAYAGASAPAVLPREVTCRGLLNFKAGYSLLVFQLPGFSLVASLSSCHHWKIADPGVVSRSSTGGTGATDLSPIVCLCNSKETPGFWHCSFQDAFTLNHEKSCL